jgi:hypothetical protein
MDGWGIIVGVVMGGVSSAVAAAPVVPKYLSVEHTRVVSAWLKEEPGVRVAEDADCRCDEDLKRERTETVGSWNAKSNYHPYYVSGDFNHDGIADFAVGIIDEGVSGKFRLVIFDGPFNKGAAPQPAFVSQPLSLGEAMFYGPPRPTPYFLVVGAFESEGMVLQPTATGYDLKDTAQ